MLWDLSHGKQAMETTSVCLPTPLPPAASSKGTLGTEALQAVVYRGRAQKNASLQLTIERGSQATPTCLVSVTLLKQKVHKCPEWIQFSYRTILCSHQGSDREDMEGTKQREKESDTSKQF